MYYFRNITNAKNIYIYLSLKIFNYSIRERERERERSIIFTLSYHKYDLSREKF